MGLLNLKYKNQMAFYLDGLVAVSATVVVGSILARVEELFLFTRTGKETKRRVPQFDTKMFKN